MLLSTLTAVHWLCRTNIIVVDSTPNSVIFLKISKSLSPAKFVHVPLYAVGLPSFSPVVKALSLPLNIFPIFPSSPCTLSPSKLGRGPPKLLRYSCFATIGEGVRLGRDSTEELESRCLRLVSKASISERMLRSSSLEVGVRCRRSGRVRGVPSMNLEGRRFPLRTVEGTVVGTVIGPFIDELDISTCVSWLTGCWMNDGWSLCLLLK
jgi:hypothetical protein